MTPKEKRKLQKQWEQLRTAIERHDRLYYKESKPEISDFEYDCLKNELRHIEQRLIPELEQIGVGDDRSGIRLTRKHTVPLLSLENTYNLDEVREFDARICKNLGVEKVTYVAEPKIDGLAVNLVYEHGTLAYALTRGNGIEGDDVTDNVKTIEELPLTLHDVPELLEVRGEVYIEESVFQQINQARREAGQEMFANARNLASGTLKLMDSEVVRSRPLRLLTYGIGAGNFFTRQHEMYAFFKQQGFASQDAYHLLSDLNALESVIEQLHHECQQFPYHTDGVVFKVDEVAQQAVLGHTAKAPRWAFAYKFEPECAETVLKKITLQIGRTGVIAPVAELVPVQLAGSTIARATLHNADEIAAKDIREGDVVRIEKSGEIIPAIVAVVKERRPEGVLPFHFPQHCPCCGTELVRDEGEVMWRCPNKNHCREQIIQRIVYFTSKPVLDIEGFGESIVRQLVEQGKIREGSDLYRLQKQDLLHLANFGEKSANRLLLSIEKSYHTTLDRWINALEIPLVGAKTAHDLAQHFASQDAFLAASEEDLSAVDGVGTKIAQSIVTFFKESSEFIHAMCAIPFRFQQQEVQNHPAFSQKVFLLTGKLFRFSRNEAQAAIIQRGGTVTQTASKRVDVVIAGEDAGQKLLWAQEQGIPVWSEDEFLGQLS
ncbi:MAG: NAD-dependent DNA ligase LigA [Verrucomicrobiota bacterium]|nr:MAG: NAD-dependent DNA ligase LigA [Verrucomicrobiota bacterium]